MTITDDGIEIAAGRYGWVCDVEDGRAKVCFDFSESVFTCWAWVIEENLEIVDKKIARKRQFVKLRRI